MTENGETEKKDRQDVYIPRGAAEALPEWRVAKKSRLRNGFIIIWVVKNIHATKLRLRRFRGIRRPGHNFRGGFRNSRYFHSGKNIIFIILGDVFLNTSYKISTTTKDINNGTANRTLRYYYYYYYTSASPRGAPSARRGLPLRTVRFLGGVFAPLVARCRERFDLERRHVGLDFRGICRV